MSIAVKFDVAMGQETFDAQCAFYSCYMRSPDWSIVNYLNRKSFHSVNYYDLSAVQFVNSLLSLIIIFGCTFCC